MFPTPWPSIALGLALISLSPVASIAAEPPVSFRNDVAPILARKCLACHGARKTEGGLSVTSLATLRRGGEGAGEAILQPGDPEASYLIESIRPGANKRMPYRLPPLSTPEIQVLTRWVSEGARYDGPGGEETELLAFTDPLGGLPRINPTATVVEPITALSFAPDGAKLAAAVGRSVVILEVETGKETANLSDHPGPINALLHDKAGKRLFAAGGRAGMFGHVTTWSLPNGAPVSRLRGHRDSALAAALSPDEKSLVTTGYDRKAIVWDLATGQPRATITDHTDAIHAVAFSPDGKSFATAGADRTVKLWDAARIDKQATLSDSTGDVLAVAFGAGGTRVLASGADRALRAWAAREKGTPLVGSAIAHDAPITRMVVSPDGKLLATAGEDRVVSLWDAASLSPVRSLPRRPDIPIALAFSPTGALLAVGGTDGTIALFEVSSGRERRMLRSAPATKPETTKPVLARNAILNPPSPRGAPRGSRVRLRLSGNGIGQSTEVDLREPGISAQIVEPRKGDANSLEVDLEIAPSARAGVHRIGLVTPTGVTPLQPFAVDPHPEAKEEKPTTNSSAPPSRSLPFTFTGVVERPGEVDGIAFDVKSGTTVVVRAQARGLGSALIPLLRLIDETGRTLGEVAATEEAADPVLVVPIERDGTARLEVTDVDFGGSGNHFHRVSVGLDPVVRSVFPLGVEVSQQRTIDLAGANLATPKWTVGPDPSQSSGTLVPVGPAAGLSVARSDGPQAIESEPNDAPGVASPLAMPGGVSGRIGRDGDVDHFRFRARKGERWVIETYGRRLGSPVDTVLEILDSQGRPLPRAVLRPISSTEVAFRDHGATTSGIRLTFWNNLAIGDTVLIGREVARILALPRNPDDDCQFWSEQGQRLGMLETTPEHHPMGQAITKVEVHPPGTTFPAGGASATTLHYRNDDGGPSFGKDARLTFDVPADGEYVARVSDVRGLGGASFGYHLVARRPAPSFRLAAGQENPTIVRGGTTLVPVTITRIDGFDDPIEVTALDLPPGVSATPAVIERGFPTGVLALSANMDAPAFSPPTWRLHARSPRDLARRRRRARPRSGRAPGRVDRRSP